jgi:hypothetical protein
MTAHASHAAFYQVAALEPGEGQPARDCWCVSFGNAHTADDRCVVAGFDNGGASRIPMPTCTNCTAGYCVRYP